MSAQNNDVNFIPEDIQRDRGIQETVSGLNKLSIGIFILIAIVAGGLTTYTTLQSQGLDQTEREILQKTSEVESLRELGTEGYKLGVRLNEIDSILKNTRYITVLLKELEKQTPANVQIVNWQMAIDNSMILEGITPSSYVPISDFQINLKESNLFEDVRIEKASFNSKEGIIDFAFKIKVNPIALNVR